MVAPVVTMPVAQAALTALAGQLYTDSVPVGSADAFSISISNGDGANTVNYSFEVSADETTWMVWVPATGLAPAGTFAQSYSAEAFKYLRVGYIRAAAADVTPVKIFIGLRKEKII